MRVVEKFEAMFGQRLTGSIKDTRSFATCLFVERILVRNPGAADVFQTQRLRFGRNALNVVATLLVREVATHGFESSFIKQSAKLFRWNSVSTCRFNVLNAECFHLVQRARNVILKLIAKTIKL